MILDIKLNTILKQQEKILKITKIKLENLNSVKELLELLYIKYPSIEKSQDIYIYEDGTIYITFIYNGEFKPESRKYKNIFYTINYEDEYSVSPEYKLLTINYL